MQNNYHFLLRALESIKKSELTSAINQLISPTEELQKILIEYDNICTTLEGSEQKWQISLQETKRQLEQWEIWAIKTEITYLKNLQPWPRFNPTLQELKLSLKLNISNCSSINSPRSLSSNIINFRNRVDEINRIISRAYITNSLPSELSVIDFHNTLEKAFKELAAFDKYIENKTGILSKLQKIQEEYRSKLPPLLQLLRDMPIEGQWALFRIFEKEFFNTDTESNNELLFVE